ncbi:MAG: helix-turn-helix domain-containing protein [Protaetiibacter sp.]
MDPILCTMTVSASALGTSRSTVYELVKQKKLKVVHIGRRAYITRDELERFAASLTREEADA